MVAVYIGGMAQIFLLWFGERIAKTEHMDYACGLLFLYVLCGYGVGKAGTNVQKRCDDAIDEREVQIARMRARIKELEAELKQQKQNEGR